MQCTECLMTCGSNALQAHVCMCCFQASLTAEHFGEAPTKQLAASHLSKCNQDCNVHYQCHQLVDNKAAMCSVWLMLCRSVGFVD
jgi:hypothetical protein